MTIYPVDSVMQILNKWAQYSTHCSKLINKIHVPVVLMLLQWKDVFVEILLELLIGIVDVELLKPVNLVIQIYKQVNFKN